ncbi:MAG TPA: hypothetical protein VE263_05105 [Candidatus Angelobacter sp.]|nr:hypothetical protein [Candidatus Angelobacter sp.]
MTKRVILTIAVLAVATGALLVAIRYHRLHAALPGVWQYTQNAKIIWVLTANGRYMKWNTDDPLYGAEGPLKWHGVDNVDLFEQREVGGAFGTPSMQVTLEPDNVGIESLSDTELRVTIWHPHQYPPERGIRFKRLNGAKSPSSRLAGVWVSDPGVPIENRFIQSVGKQGDSGFVATAVPDSERLEFRSDGTWAFALPLSEKNPLPEGPLPVWWLEGDQLQMFVGWPPKAYMKLPVRFENDGRVFFGGKGAYRRSSAK